MRDGQGCQELVGLGEPDEDGGCLGELLREDCDDGVDSRYEGDDDEGKGEERAGGDELLQDAVGGSGVSWERWGCEGEGGGGSLAWQSSAAPPDSAARRLSDELARE